MDASTPREAAKVGPRESRDLFSSEEQCRRFTPVCCANSLLFTQSAGGPVASRTPYAQHLDERRQSRGLPRQC